MDLSLHINDSEIIPQEYADVVEILSPDIKASCASPPPNGGVENGGEGRQGVILPQVTMDF